MGNTLERIKAAYTKKLNNIVTTINKISYLHSLSVSNSLLYQNIVKSSASGAGGSGNGISNGGGGRYDNGLNPPNQNSPGGKCP